VASRARAGFERTRKRQRIVLMVGLPGSGKSTYLERLGVAPLSSDAIRQLLADDATTQTIHGRVFATIRYLLRQRLAIGRAVTYVDATHLTPAERRPYVKMARQHGCDVEAVFFDVPLEFASRGTEGGRAGAGGGHAEDGGQARAAQSSGRLQPRNGGAII
jgi:hypothetical protein